MKYQCFDSGALFIPSCERWENEAANSVNHPPLSR